MVQREANCHRAAASLSLSLSLQSMTKLVSIQLTRAWRNLRYSKVIHSERALKSMHHALAVYVCPAVNLRCELEALVNYKTHLLSLARS
jgi:hypothetical protein